MYLPKFNRDSVLLILSYIIIAAIQAVVIVGFLS